MSRRRSRTRTLLNVERLEDRQLMSAGPLDDFANTLAGAQAIPFGAGPPPIQIGRVDYPGDVDAFSFIAPLTGPLSAHLFAGRGSTLDTFLVIHDLSGQEIGRSDNLAADVPDSQVAFAVVAGRTYYVEAAASPFAPASQMAQSYILTLTPYADDASGSLDTPVSLTAGEIPLVHNGTIEVSGDEDVFTFVTEATAGLSVRMNSGGQLDPHLTVFTTQGTVIADNDDSLDTFNSLLTFRTEAGQRYVVRAAASGNALAATSKGEYRLILTAFDDKAGSTPAHALTITVPARGLQTVAGSVGSPGDTDVLRFVAARTGPIVVHQEGLAGLDTNLAILDANGAVVASNNDIASTSSHSRILLHVVEGQTYFVRAGGHSVSTGDYELRLTSYRDEAGNSHATARPLTFDGSSSMAISHRLEAAGDLDIFSFQASITGDLFVEMTVRGEKLVAPVLSALNSTGQTIAQRIGSETAGQARLLFSVTAGQTYFVRAGGGVEGMGDYRLSFGPLVDDFGNDLTSARAVSVPLAGTVVQRGVAGTADVDVFSFFAPFTGSLFVRLGAVNSSVDLAVEILDAEGTVVASSDDTGASRDSRTALDVVQDQVYFVRARSLQGAGEYALTLGRYVDDVSGSLAGAPSLSLNAGGRTVRGGRIEVTGDLDVHRFVAPFTGQLIIRQNAAVGSNLDSLLTILDADGTEIAQDDESGGRRNARLIVEVEQGQTYFVRAAAFPANFSLPASAEAGAYELIFQQAGDDFGNSSADAGELVVDATGAARINGEIGQPLDVDVLRFVPAVTGAYTIRQQNDNSTLDSLLVLLDADGNELSSNDDNGGSLDSRLDLTLTGGVTYFLRAGAFSESQGAYVLTLTPLLDDHPSTREGAEVLTLTETLTAINGSIEAAGDVDVFRYAADRTLGLVIQQQASGSILDSLLRVFDAFGNEIASNDDSEGRLDSKLLINVEEGQTYYFQAGAFGTSSGAYSLTIQSYDDDAPNAAIGASVIDLLPDQPTSRDGVIDVVGDIDFFQFVAPDTGTLRVRMRNNGGSGFLDSFLTVQTFGGLTLAQNEDAGSTLNSEVMLDVVAGETYFVQASPSPQATGLLRTGSYQLSFDPIQPPHDDAGNTFATASDIALSANGAVTRRGLIERPGDRDFYRFNAPLTGGFVFRLESNHGGNLDPILAIFDAGGNLVALNDDNSEDGRLDSFLRFFIVAGETYFLRASAFGASTGSYRLLLHPDVPFFDDVTDRLADASWVFIDPQNPVFTFGALERPWDHDVIALVTLTTGEVLVRATPLNGGFMPLVSVFDFQGAGGPHTFDNGAPIPEVSVPGGNFFLYFIDVAAADIGASEADFYSLDIFYSNDDFPDIINDNAAIGFTDNQAVVNGTLDRVRDLDNLFFDAPTTGSFVLEMTAVNGSSVAPRLTLRDRNRNIIAVDTGFLGGKASFTVTLSAGERYYVEAAGEGLGLGDYRLNLAPTPDEDELGSVWLGTPGQRVRRGGFIGVVGDFDLYQFTADRSGSYRFRADALAGSKLDAQLMILDDAFNLVATNDDFQGMLDSRLFADLEAGRDYYAVVLASPGAVSDSQIGGYGFSVAPVETLAAPTSIAAAVGTAGGGELYRFIAPQTGGLTIDLRGAGSGVDTFLTLYDEAGRQIAQNNDSGGTTNSLLQLNVLAGQVYYLEASASPVAASGAQTGNFSMSLSFGAPLLDIATSTRTIALNGSGEGSFADELMLEGEQQVFRFQANRSGVLTVRNTQTDSSLDATLYLYDAANQLIATVRGANGQATFDAIARQTYFVRVAATPFAAPGASLGAFEVMVSPDDVGGFANAVTLGSAASGSLQGLGDLDVFQLVATGSGQMTVNLSSATGGRLNASVALFDADQNQVAVSGGAVSFNAVAGQTYFVSVNGNDSSTSKYNLDVNFEAQTNVPAPTPTTGETPSAMSTSDGSGESSDSNASLALFRDPTAVEEGDEALADSSQQVTDLQTVGDSSAALVAVLLVGAADDLLLEETDGDEETRVSQLGGLDEWLTVSEQESEEKVDSRTADILFAWMSELEEVAFRQRMLVGMLSPMKQPEVIVELLLRAAKKAGLMQPGLKSAPGAEAMPEPDITDLLIPDPRPSTETERPDVRSQPATEPNDQAGIDPLAASLAMATLVCAGHRVRRPRTRRRVMVRL